MAIPNCKHIVRRLSEDFPQEWFQAHRGGPQTEAFIRRLAWELHSTVHSGFGLLGQYGDPTRIADDAIMYLGEGPGVDAGTGRPQSGFDVIASAGSDAASPAWIDISGPGKAIWVKPEPVGGSGGGVDPLPIDPPPPPVQDLAPLLAMATQIAADLKTLSDTVRGIDARTRVIETDTAAAAHESLNAAVRASEIKTQLETLPADTGPTTFPVYEGRVWGSTIRLTPKG